MSYTLFIRLAGPMQSWGVMSRFSRRDSGKEPSKSGIIGLVCAAMGIPRDDDKHPDFVKLAKAKLGIRVVKGGVLQSDYHTAQNIAKADGGTKETELSTRFYLADADFIAALQTDDRELLERIHEALKKPKWQLFLGRKAFVPHLPVYVRDDAAIIETADDLRTVLSDPTLVERLCEIRPVKADDEQRLIIEDDTGSEVRPDVPLSFADRRFSIRRVATAFAYPKGGESDGIVS